MAYIKEYWDEKQERIKQAEEHTRKMNEKYVEEIKCCIGQTTLYDYKAVFENTNSSIFQSEIILEALDSVSALFKHRESKTALLNFSSYKEAGGMFLQGSRAQEECLCHESFLYNVLSGFTESFYAWNSNHKNKALYMNRALYSPNVIFEREVSVECDIITCAAPNRSAAQRFVNVSSKENSIMLESRIKFILDIAQQQNVDTLILGAYGCGVFGQDATEVAAIFSKYLQKQPARFSKVVFAIPNGKDGNYTKFSKVFA